MDIEPVPLQGVQHWFVHKSALDVEAADLHGLPLDMVFFDCHSYDVQIGLYHRSKNLGLITHNTVLALHDTNLHFREYTPSVKVNGGFAHQIAERQMVNDFHAMGYQVFNLHTTPDRHSSEFPFRHGITLWQQFGQLSVL